MAIIELNERRKWFNKLIVELKKKGFEQEKWNTCPCCGYPTIGAKGNYEICMLCMWEDDGQDDEDADKILGGPNHDYSLSEARTNFYKYLTMYRPNDERAFKIDTGKNNLKIKVIDLFWKLDLKMSKKEFDKNKNEIKFFAKELILP